MPEIEINGEKKKVACGPCIRGHRSSKCTHKDRVLIEVRKPGRPLSACPHPSGSCGCERMVVNYTLPKTQHCGSCTSGSSSNLPSTRVQKGKNRKQSGNITPAALQRAISTESAATSQNTTIASIKSTASYDEPFPSPNGTLRDAQTFGVKSTADPNYPPHPRDHAQTKSNVNTSSAPPLRLGMFGVGGARARDEIGWSEPYPDMHSVQYEQNGVSRHLLAPTDNTASPAEDVVAAETSSCCAPRQQPKAASTSSPEDGKDDSSTARSQHASNFGSPLPLYGTALHAQDGVPHGSVGPNGDGTNGLHTCNCGEGCDCLACLTHPYNKTTLDYVRYHTDIAMRYGEVFSPPGMIGMPSSPNATSTRHSATNANGTIPWNQSGFNAGHTPGSHDQWQSGPNPQATPTYEADQINLHAPQPAEKEQVAVPTDVTTPQSNGKSSSHAPSTPAFDFNSLDGGAALDSNSPQQQVGETFTLSPSTFFLQSYTLPGCDDATGTCQCGDGCTCVGCLTHTGHQRAQQGAPTSNPYPSHGSGCACPHPKATEQPSKPPVDPRGAPQHQPATPYVNGHHASPSTNYMPPPPTQNGPPVSTFTHVHGPSCACPVDGAVLQAQAQVQAHAQLHGPTCRCPTGMTYLTAQLQAEARLHQQLHGDGVPTWAGGPPG